MAVPNFTFTRAPSVKTRAKIVTSGLVAADNALVIIGHMAASGSTATAGTPISIDAYGDEVAAATECTTKFGASSEAGAMVVAAIKAVKFSDIESKVYPPIKVIPLANGDTSSALAASLAANITLPMPFVALCYNASDATASAALKAHLAAISGDDRGLLAQFGSFGFIGADGTTTATVAGYGTTAATENIIIPWLKDSAGTKANKVYEVSAAVAAVAAANGLPFYSMSGIKVGGLVAPVSAADWQTPGDAGTSALGLAGGVTPLEVNASGEVTISRLITTRVTVSGTVDADYYDLADWQVLYYLRKQAYVLAQKPRYKRAKASDTKIKALLSEIIQACKKMEELEMLQHVDLFADQFTATRSLTNRNAAVYSIPVNVIPAFENKGIELLGSDQFDVVA